MNCKDCEHFHIRYEPVKGVDTGLAECRKHDLVVDFLNHKKLERLECVEQVVYFNGEPVCNDGFKGEGFTSTAAYDQYMKDTEASE